MRIRKSFYDEMFSNGSHAMTSPPKIMDGAWEYEIEACCMCVLRALSSCRWAYKPTLESRPFVLAHKIQHYRFYQCSVSNNFI